MKVESKLLRRAFKQLPKKQRQGIFAAVRKSVLEGVRLAKTMAPTDDGDLMAGIHPKFEAGPNRFTGSVEAAPADPDSQIKALSVEFGRQYKRGNKRQPVSGGKKFTGTTQPNPFIRRTKAIIARKHKARVRRAMNKAVKEVGFR